MTACLRCDGCSKAVAEHEADLRNWWRLTRHGVEWAEEAAAPKPLASYAEIPQISLSTTFVGEFTDEDVELFDGEADGSDDFLDEEISSVVMHFCSATCLVNWGQQASCFDAPPEGAP